MRLKLFLLSVIAVTSLGVFAQKSKFGHINSNDLLVAMPARQKAEDSLKIYAAKLERELSTMTKEYEDKVKKYNAEAAGWSDLIKENREKEIIRLEEQIKTFEVSAQQELQSKEQALLKPIVEDAKSAIKKVAEANGYTYVFDTSVGVIIHAPEGDNILELVKKELGLVQ